jgi:4,5:9,10-diseco-3-hydroxy-5,9,17-trioxoandrosta-1(10),2-diene-4-oate hydrolase
VEDWAWNVASLAAHHCVYALDLVGSGQTDKPPSGYSLPALARFLHDFVVGQDIGAASLVGHSLGGAVALHFALQFPDKAEKLVLVSSAGLGREVDSVLRLSSLPLVGEWLTRPRREGITRFLEKSFHDPELVTGELIELCYRMASLPGAQQALLSTTRAVIGLRGQRSSVVGPLVDSLVRITTPVLVIWGRQDRTVPVDHAQVALEGLPQARLHILDRCGHFPQMEHPRVFNELVLEFLDKGTA